MLHLLFLQHGVIAFVLLLPRLSLSQHENEELREITLSHIVTLTRVTLRELQTQDDKTELFGQALEH